jgi:hypothetical protein
MSSTTTTTDSIKQSRKYGNGTWDLSPRGAWTLLSQGAEARVKVPTVRSNANQSKIDDDVNVSFAKASSSSGHWSFGQGCRYRLVAVW